MINLQKFCKNFKQFFKKSQKISEYKQNKNFAKKKIEI